MKYHDLYATAGYRRPGLATGAEWKLWDKLGLTSKGVKV